MRFRLPRELSGGGDQAGPPPGTEHGTWHTASHPGDSLRGNCSNSATCFPRPQPPLVPSHWGPHGGRRGKMGVGGGERDRAPARSAGALRHRALCPAHPGSPGDLRRGSLSPCWLSLGLPRPGLWGADRSLGYSGASLQGEKLGLFSPKARAIFLLGPQGGQHRAGPQKDNKGNGIEGWGRGSVQACRAWSLRCFRVLFGNVYGITNPYLKKNFLTCIYC